MKTLLIMAADRKFLPGLRKTWQSLCSNNPWMKDLDRVLISNEITEFDGFRVIEEPWYCEKAVAGIDRLNKAYAKLEAFNPELTGEYDRVLVIDADILCVGDISELVSEDLDKYCVYGCLANGRTFTLDGELNTGVLAINPQLLLRDSYDDLVSMIWDQEWKLADQSCLNEWIRSKGVPFGILHQKYNAANRLWKYHRDAWNRTKPRMIHYVGNKPWLGGEKGYEKLERLWDERGLCPNKPRVLIVGSGTSVEKYDFGRYIDQFDVVVRFNGFQTGTSERAGSKADVVYCNATSDSRANLLNNPLSDCKYVLAYHQTNLQRRNMMDMKRRLRKGCREVEVIGRGLLNKCRALPAQDAPTLGYLTINEYLSQELQVCIHGFDYVDDPDFTPNADGTGYHYFNPAYKSSYQAHHLDEEAEKIRGLINEGRVVELKSLVYPDGA